MLKKTFALYCAIFSFLLPSVVYAATLKNIHGVVKINKGDGYHTVDKTIIVNPGDRIMANLDASADIVYPNGISVPVKPGHVAIVKSTFKKPMTVGRRDGERSIVREAEHTIRRGSQHIMDQTGSFVSAIDPAAVLVGGVAIGGGIAAAISLSRDDKPASP